MSNVMEPSPPTERDLVMTRLLDAPRAAVFRAWGDPALLARWWAPAPFRVSHCALDFRAGGTFSATMKAPDGAEFPHRGIFLDIVAPERIVFTDAYSRAWVPSAKPFMTAVITLDEKGSQTLYTACARHWSVADRDAHEAMGFQQGWGLCADQLAAVARSL